MTGLFDDIVRSEHGFALSSEPQFNYLNRTARVEFAGIRSKLGAWFKHYPNDAQNELRQRFRSSINEHHRSAFFELLLHETFRKLEYGIRLHPDLQNGLKTRPDFLLTKSVTEEFLMEAVSGSSALTIETAQDKIANRFYDDLNRLIDSPNFFLGIWFPIWPQQQPAVRKLAQEITRWLSTLDPDVKRESHQFDIRMFNSKSFELEVTAIPKDKKFRGLAGTQPIGIRGGRALFINDRERISDKICEKVGRYGTLNRPYIVALNIHGMISEGDITEALFGRNQQSIKIPMNGSIAQAEAHTEYIPDGVWQDYSGPRNTRLSGVLVFENLHPWSLLEAKVCLFVNPWAEHKVPDHLKVFTIAQLTDVGLVRKEGVSLGAILERA